MPDAQHLLLFILAGLLLNLTPGPDVLYIVGNALRSGARAGVVAALGINAGCFVHILAAALGVGALLAASATAFAVLTWAGAAYLVWLGVRLLLGRDGAQRWGSLRSPPACEQPPAYEQQAGSEQAPAREQPPPANPAAAGSRPAAAQDLWAVFRGGFLTNVLNPKVAIFFLAFVPQFIPADSGHQALAFLLLGAVFIVNSVAVNTLWAFAAAWVARTQAVRRSLPWLDRMAGVMFMGFGLRLALSDNSPR